MTEIEAQGLQERTLSHHDSTITSQPTADRPKNVGVMVKWENEMGEQVTKRVNKRTERASRKTSHLFKRVDGCVAV
jgi:hypothetical protein